MADIEPMSEERLRECEQWGGGPKAIADLSVEVRRLKEREKLLKRLLKCLLGFVWKPGRRCPMCQTTGKKTASHLATCAYRRGKEACERPATLRHSLTHATWASIVGKFGMRVLYLRTVPLHASQTHATKVLL